MITQDMLTSMTHDVLQHAQKHLYDAFDILRALDGGQLSLDEKLSLVECLKDHLGIVQGDAARALLIVGE